MSIRLVSDRPSSAASSDFAQPPLREVDTPRTGGVRGLRIEEYTLADLADRLRSGVFWDGEVIPITKHRALSQIRNPRAHPEDLSLLVAYDDDRVVGYIGVLPDLVFLNGEGRRIGWLSAWWANPDPKYARIGLVLMVKAFRAYGGAVGASGFSEDARRVYEASKLFLTVDEQARLKAVVRLNTHELLPRKFPILSRLKALFGIADVLLNVVCNLRLRLWRLRFGIGKELRVEYIAQVDSETNEFIERLHNEQDSGSSRRGQAEINWIAQHPWVLQVPVGQVDNNSFYFSATARESNCFMAKVFNVDGLMVGFVMLRLIDGHLTVPLCYMLNQHSDDVFRVVAEHAVALRVHSLSIGREELRRSLARLNFPCIARINRSTRSTLGNAFSANEAENLDPQDGDGDCAFWS